MPLIPIALPPGVWRNGTKYQATGRWYDVNMVRWLEGAMQPIGGWEKVVQTSPSAQDVDLDGRPRGIVAWRTNTSLKPWLYVGTHTDSYAFSQGVLVETTYEQQQGTLTLTGNAVNAETVTIGTKTYTWETVLTDVDGNVLIGATASDSLDNLIAAINLASGAGTTYADSMTVHPTVTAAAGVGDTMVVTAYVPKTTGNEEATTETMTNGSWGDATLQTTASLTSGNAHTVVAVGNYGDGNYGDWNWGGGDPLQGTVDDADTWQLDTFGEWVVGCFTADGRLMYWDADTDNRMRLMTNSPTGCVGIVVTPERFVVALGAGGDARTIQWADQESVTVWTAAATNQAGNFIISDSGNLMCGRRMRAETLIWTTEALWAMRYIGGTLVYSFEELSRGCGIIARNAVALIEGSKAAWMAQRAFYLYDGFVRPVPCEVSDYIFNDFNYTQRAKVAAVNLSQFGEVWWFYPSGTSIENDRYVTWNYRENHWTYGILARTCGADLGVFDHPIFGGVGGALWEHERGNNRGANTVYAESGPIEIGTGDTVMHVRQVVPDELNLGEVDVKLYHALYPTATESVTAALTAANPTDVRITARQVRLRVEDADNQESWRVGRFRLEATPGGLR